MKKFFLVISSAVLAIALTHCGKKADVESENKVSEFTVDSGNCPASQDNENADPTYIGSCQATFTTIPGSEHTNFSFELKAMLQANNSFFQLNLNSQTKTYANGAQIRLRRVDNTVEASIRFNASGWHTVTTYQMRFVDPNNIQVAGTIIPTDTSTRLIVWNLGDTPSNALFDSNQPGHFTNGLTAGTTEVMPGLFRGFTMQAAVLKHIQFLSTAILP